MSERRGTKGLELWCRRMTEGYPGVKVENMTTSWRDGLAFCAIIHHFRPDLLDFSKLNKDDIYYNNELAFRTAEHHLGIPALLEPEDMVECAVPDRLSILTYLSQFYQTFVASQGSPSRIVPKRPSATSERPIVSPTSTAPSSKIPKTSTGVIRRDPCAKCGLPVFIAERLNVGKLLFHRTCFRCARCSSQLTLANYYETESNQFCCETCPDEEIKDSKETTCTEQKPDVLTRSLSDEEKSASLKKQDKGEDEHSAHSEVALESQFDSTINSQKSPSFTSAMSYFINSQIENVYDTKFNNENSVAEDDIPPDLPKSEPPCLSRELQSHKDIGASLESSSEVSVLRASENIKNVSKDTLSEQAVVNSAQNKFYNSGFSQIELTVNKDNSITNDNRRNQLEAADVLLATDKVVTKEDDSHISLVKARMKLFEAGSSIGHSENKNKTKQKFSPDPLDLEKSRGGFGDSQISKPDSVHIKKGSTDHDSHSSSIPEIIVEVPLNKDKDVSPLDVDQSVSLGSDSNNVSLIVSKETNHSTQYSEAVTRHKSRNSFNSTVESGNFIEEDITNTNKDYFLTHSKEESPESVQGTMAEANKPNEENEHNLTIESTPSSESYSKLYENVSSVITISSNDSSLQKRNESSEVIVISDSSNSTKIKENYEDYPEDLNPFGSDEEKDPLNPFSDDDEFENKEDAIEDAIPPKPAARKKITPGDDFRRGKRISNAPEYLSEIYVTRLSNNPFEDDEEEEETKDGKLEIREDISKRNNEGNTRKVISAAKLSLNPFWSDDEEPDDAEFENEEMEMQKPIPKPRSSKTSMTSTNTLKSALSISDVNGESMDSYSSLSSVASNCTIRKKKIAPLPITDSDHSPCPSLPHSPRLTPKSRKTKRAPLPPTASSTPYHTVKMQTTFPDEALPLTQKELHEDSQTDRVKNWENEKTYKDEENRNRQSQVLSTTTPNYASQPDKSTHGKWKRRKGPAPARPIPQRRQIKPLPIAEIKRELDFIEVQQQGLERQGVRLEQIIREKCEGPDCDPEDNVSSEVEELILQLFELVNEKNELFRKQTELMYLRRQQRLEEEYADLEYQIRCLMLQPEINKTDSDKTREEELITRLVEVVERRNEIVECLEMDRLREAEEDDNISKQMNLYSLKRKDEKVSPNSEDIKKEKKLKIRKKLKLKTGSPKIDADKDIDESERSNSLSSKKDKKKKKFNLF